jgi:hypothetical protein
MGRGVEKGVKIRMIMVSPSSNRCDHELQPMITAI